MSFLQPLLLIALPLMALPVLIHLINQQRHRTVSWAAMMFLLDAKRMTRGMARLRHVLILLMRIAAVGALIFAVSRPLASGWLGLTAGGAPDTTIVLLDRSASMEQQDLQTGESKRSTGLHKVAELLEKTGKNTRIVLIESTENRAQEVRSPKALLDMPNTSATSTTADVPAMMQTALDYITANKTGRTDVWICSDLRENDWNPKGGRWGGIREGFADLKGLRLYLISYSQPARDNVAITVDRVFRRQTGIDAELVMDIGLRRESQSSEPLTLPLAIVVNGVRSVVEVEMTENEYSLQGHAIPLDKGVDRGWGRVELPADSNPRDNTSYFVFAKPPEHRTVVVSDNPAVARNLQLAAAAPVDAALSYSVDVLPSDRVDEIDWNATALVLWQAALPDGVTARQLENFVDAGKTVVFFPVDQAGTNQLFDAQWGAWQSSGSDEPERIAWWRDDADLLGNSRSGTALPVGDLQTYRYCSIKSSANSLARFDTGEPLLARVPTRRGVVYFCSTLPCGSHSSLARDGVVFYVMLQRALTQGASVLGIAQQRTAGVDALKDDVAWRPLDELQPDGLASARGLHAAAFQNGEHLVAINRPLGEDAGKTVDFASLDRLLQGLDYHRIDDQVGNLTSLASEIWQAFLIAMVLALIVEAILCLQPRKSSSTAEPMSAAFAPASPQPTTANP